MKVFKKTFLHIDTTKEVAVNEAVENSCNYSHYDEGELDYIKVVNNRQSEIIGKLVAILVNKNLITANELDTMLCYEYGASEE